MKARGRHYRIHPQFPFIAVQSGDLAPSYLTIGGSGIVGNFGPESPMSNYENSESPTREAGEGASMESGSGAAAGAAPTYGGSGVA